jgi:hypothetical protein
MSNDTLTFGTAPAPAVRAGRNAEPNPFSDHFPTKVDDKGNHIALTVEYTGDAEKNKEAIAKLTGKARRAAAALDTPMTARVSTVEKKDSKGKVTGLTVYFWTVDKITRNSGDSAPESAAPAE